MCAPSARIMHRVCGRLTTVWAVVWSALLVNISSPALMDDNVNINAPMEYCNMEVFNATCQQDEVVVMESASYGRMKLGRCVKGNYGHLGCEVNILGYMDRKCSGAHVCRFSVPDTEIYKTKPCPGDFTSYMDASYKCVRVARVDIQHCQRYKEIILIRTSVGFIASQITEELGLGTSQCPYVVEVNPGQRINVSLYNFVRSYTMSSSGLSDPVNMDVCFDVLKITEGSSETKIVNLCGRDARNSEVYLSKTSTIEIEFLDQRLLRSVGKFLIKYEAVSCPDVRPPPEAWVKRTGDVLMISCNNTQEKWYLTCRRDSWVGTMGNCSAAPPGTGTKWSLTHVFSEQEIFPYGILVVVAIGILLGVVIGGVLLAIIFFMSKSRSKRRHERQHVYIDNKENMRILDSNNSNNGALGTTSMPAWLREAQYTDEGIVRDIRSPLPARDRPPDDRDRPIIQNEAHLHSNPHACDIIPINESLSTFKPPRSHFYESPTLT